MQDLPYDTEDLICALATPWAPSALAVIRTTGQGCIEALAPLWESPSALLTAKGYSAVYGRLLDADKTPLDDLMAIVYRAPHSATGQDTVELSCHGSLPGLRRILDTLHRSGFRPAQPGEFTLRGFLNGKLDLTQAEAVQEVVAAQTSRAQSMALDRLAGSVTNRIDVLKKRLLDLVALLNIQLDYAEDDVESIPLSFEVIDEIRSDLAALSATYRTGKVVQEGIRVALAGRTNAGKSSLFNALLKEDRSIVSEEHGTTRDWLEAVVNFDGVPVRLFDTAGLREASNAVEREGIRRSHELMDSAEVLLYLIDGTAAESAEDRAFLDSWKNDPRLLVVRTKADLVTVPADGLSLSSKTGQGVDDLQAAVLARVPGLVDTASGSAVIDSLRQKQLLDRAVEALDLVREGVEQKSPLDMLALDVLEALQALGELTGEVTNADVLTHMFSNFCVGK